MKTTTFNTAKELNSFITNVNIADIKTINECQVITNNLSITSDSIQTYDQTEGVIDFVAPFILTLNN